MTHFNEITVTFRNGRQVIYTSLILDLLKSDPDVISITDTDGNPIYSPVIAPENAEAAGIEAKAIKDLKKGEFFTLQPIAAPDEKKVYIRDEYDRSTKKYTAVKYTDCLGNGREFKPGTIVYTGFTF